MQCPSSFFEECCAGTRSISGGAESLCIIGANIKMRKADTMLKYPEHSGYMYVALFLTLLINRCKNVFYIWCQWV